MTKTMEINELVSELKEYDGELTVKVWSNGANVAYPISHVGQGYTDGVLDTYVGIVIGDDDNLVDLAKVEIEEEAFCTVIDYCNCGICTKNDKCQLSPQHMCLRGRAFYDGFIMGAKLYKGSVCQNLESLWHDASEMPKEGEWILIQFDEDYYDTLVLCNMDADTFCAWCKMYGVIRWAYISDLLPKGGAR